MRGGYEGGCPIWGPCFFWTSFLDQTSCACHQAGLNQIWMNVSFSEQKYCWTSKATCDTWQISHGHCLKSVWKVSQKYSLNTKFWLWSKTLISNLLRKSETWNQDKTKGWRRVMEEHTSFRRGGQADRGGEGCDDGRGDGVLLSDGQHSPPWDQPQQLQVSLPSPPTHPSPKKSESKTCSTLDASFSFFTFLSTSCNKSANIESKPRRSNSLWR